MKIIKQLKDHKGREMDISKIKSVSDKEFKEIVDSLTLEQNEKNRIVDFLIYRRSNFDSLLYA